MVRAIARRVRNSRWQKWYPAVFAGVGLLGILTCGYGYAAQSTDLLIEGRATVAGNTEIRNVEIKVASKTDDAYEAYSAEYASKSATMYPEITAKNGQITYTIKTCNYSKTKTFELVGLDEPATAIGSLESAIDKVTVGTTLVLGTKVAPGECVETEVSFTQTGNSDTIGSMTLDYTWAEYNGVPFSIDYMQDMTPQICAATSSRETKQLIDKRDGKKYWVTKMHDGNCWMVQDLDYDGGGDVRYTADTVGSWDNDGTSSPAEYMYNGDNEKGHESDGSYYSYQAAMAVCPTGWRLATGDVDGEWDKLLDVQELNDLGNSGKNSWSEWWDRAAEAPFYLRMTGYTENKNGIRSYGETRTGWTSTRSAARPNTSMAIGWGDEYPQQKYWINWDDTNFYGEPVRCIAKHDGDTTVKELLTIETMQEMTVDVCDVSQEGDSKQLIDERDGKTYWVTKMHDGKCWMTQNLDYDGGGTRFDANTGLSNWISEYHSRPAQYYYVGDNDQGRSSHGSYYSYDAAINVCPAGWHLPTGGPGGEYEALLGGNKLGSSAAARVTASQKNPYFFTLSGWVDNSGRTLDGTGANYRSTRGLNDSIDYTVDIQYNKTASKNVFNTNAEDDYYYGSSVRCVAGDSTFQEVKDIFTIDTMQALTPQICMNTTVYDEEARRLLTDTRDGHQYWVTRLSKDSNCWMVQNLDYDGGGTRFDASSNKANWNMNQADKPKQYYYRGDWQDGLTSYGTLYTWYSAQDVCPTGWRLPTGGPNSEETNLWSGIANSTAGINKLKAAPFYFVPSGFYENSGLNSEGQEGYWWSSTVSTTGGYVMSYNTKGSKTNPYIRNYTDEGGYWGESVRCLVSGN